MIPTCDKLNVGSGKTYLEGFHNLELNPKFRADEYASMTEVLYPSESFSLIAAWDVVDHVPLVLGKQMFQKFYGWLKPNGVLHIHTPNLRFIAQNLAEKDNHECIKWLYGTDGEGSTNYDTNCIRWCYSKESLVTYLNAVGFKVLQVNEDCLGFGLSVVAVKKC